MAVAGKIVAVFAFGLVVACSDSSTAPGYTVGGTVSGMVGNAGLVLQNNGGNDLPVATNGSFTFGSMPSGSSYIITVLSPNFARGNCTVVNGTGTVPTANVSNVTVTCIAPFSGHEVVTSIATTGAVGALGTTSVICTGNKRILSGGYRSQNGAEVWRVWRSRPVDATGSATGDRGWAISFVSVVAGQSVTVHAICATPAANMEHEVVTSAAVQTGTAGNIGSVSVQCAGARRLLGGGYSSASAVEVWRVGRNRGVDGGGVQTGFFGWGVAFMSVVAGESVNAHAVCSQAPQDLGHEIETANTTTGASGTLGTVSVICPVGKRVLGGGFTVNAADIWRVWRSYPVDAGVQVGDRGWAVDFTSILAGQTVTAFAVCGFAPS